MPVSKISAGILAGSSVFGSLNQYGLQAQAYSNERKLITHRGETQFNLTKNIMATEASYYEKAGMPYIPQASFGQTMRTHEGNNFTNRSNTSSGVKFSGTQAQTMFNVGNFR